MKIVYAMDSFGPNGPIPNSIGMRTEELFSHFYRTPISRGMSYFSLPDFHRFIDIDAIYAHHSDILKNTELYSAQGPIMYVINIQHNMRYQSHFLFGGGRGSWIEYLPENIITLWKNKKCKIIISHIWDDCEMDIIRRILDSFYNKFGSCENMYVWSTSIFKSFEIAKINPIYQKNLVHIPYAELWSINQLPPYAEPGLNIVKNKKFIKLVRRYSPARVLSHVSFAKANLNEEGFVSMPAKCTGVGKTLQHYIKDELNIEDGFNALPSVLDQISLDDREKDGYKNTWLGFSKREELLDYFHRSYFSIVFESRFEDPKLYTFCTEKLMRAILYKHPFILMCTPQSLLLLRTAGYKTFNSVWPEDYDKIEDSNERVERVTQVVKDLCLQDLDNIIARCSEIVEHNRLNVFKRADEFKTYINGLAN